MITLAMTLSACRTGQNYPGEQDPRYAGVGPMPANRSIPDTLRVVSFNVKYAQRIDSAIVVLTTESALSQADIVLLQEMDARGTRRIAEALGMSYVYYPAIFRRRSGKDFGNAVLSRWPITADRKTRPSARLALRAHAANGHSRDDQHRRDRAPRLFNASRHSGRH